MKCIFYRLAKYILTLCAATAWVLAQPNPSSGDSTYLNLVRYSEQKQYTEALAVGKELLERSEIADDTFLRAVKAAQFTGQLNDFKFYLEERLQRLPLDARFHYGLGLLLQEQGDLPAAFRQHRQCLQRLPEFSASFVALMTFDKSWQAQIEELITELLTHNPQSPNALLGRGLFLRKQGQHEAALAEFTHALSLNPAFTEACYQQVLTLNLNSKVVDSLTANRACLPASESKLTVKQRRDFVALEINNLARSEQTDAALEKLEQAWKLSHAMGDESYRSVYDFYQGTLYQQKGDYARALQAHQSALSRSNLGSSLGEQINAGRLHVQIGRDYFFLGAYDLAEKNYREGLAYAQRLNQPNNQALVYGFLGDLWMASGNLSKATSAYQQAIQLSSSTGNLDEQNLYYATLSRLYLRDGELQKAEGVIQQALEKGRASGVSAIQLGALENLGELHLRRAAADSARNTYAELLSEAQARANWQFELHAQAGLARARELAGQLDQARKHYLQAIHILESMRARLTTSEQKVGFFQDKIEIYRKLMTVLRKLPQRLDEPDQTSEIFVVAERARSRALLESLGEQAVFDQIIAPELLRERRELQGRFSQLETELSKAQAAQPLNPQKINSLQNSLQQISDNLTTWQQNIRQQQPRFAALRYPQPLSVAQVQQLLKQK